MSMEEGLGRLGATDRGWWMMDCDQVFRWSWSQVGRLTGNMKSWCFDPRRQTSRHFYYDMTGSWELRGCKYQINILFYINSCLDVTLCWNNTCHKIENNSIQKLAWNFSTIRYNQIDPHNIIWRKIFNSFSPQQFASSIISTIVTYTQIIVDSDSQ